MIFIKQKLKFFIYIFVFNIVFFGGAKVTKAETQAETFIYYTDEFNDYAPKITLNPRFGSNMNMRGYYKNGHVYIRPMMATSPEHPSYDSRVEHPFVWTLKDNDTGVSPKTGDSTGWHYTTDSDGEYKYLMYTNFDSFVRNEAKKDYTSTFIAANGWTYYVRYGNKMADIGGVKPNEPSFVDYTTSDSKFYFKLNATANMFPYFWCDYSTTSGFIPTFDTSLQIYDYCTGFWYHIDDDASYNIATGSNGKDVKSGTLFNALNKSDNKKCIDLTAYKDEAVNKYLHVRTRSYSGLLSNQSTFPLKSTKVIFHNDTGTEVGNQVFWYKNGTQNFKSASSMGVSKDGVAFLGWSTKKGASSYTYRDGTDVANNWIKTNAGNTIDLYPVWEEFSTTVKYHAEDEKNSFAVTYTTGKKGQKLTEANYWWIHQRKNCTWRGWSETKDSSKVGYSNGCDVADVWIKSHAGKTVDLYSVWDKPTVTVKPTEDNVSFNCNGTTYYKAPVEFEVKGADDHFDVSSVTIWSEKSKVKISAKSSSYKKKYGADECISTDLLRVHGQSTAGSGVSDVASCDVNLDETAPAISSNVMDYGSKVVKTTSSDSQSGVARITLEYLKDGVWYEKTHYDTNSAEYGTCDSRLSVGSTYYGCKHRIKVTDHVGNTSYTRPFFVVPLELTTLLSKYNGDTAYNTQTLTFIAGGDLTATLKVKVSGYPDRIKYEYAPELGQATEEYNVTPNESGNVYETKTFTVPYTILHDTDYYVKVTAYRNVDDDNTDVVSTIEYVRMADIDFSIFKSKIIYQSGMHM